MKQTLFFLMALLPAALPAQHLQVIASGGQQPAGGGARITATIGEVCVGMLSNDEHLATEGFQQGEAPAPPAPPMRGGEALRSSRPEILGEAGSFANPPEELERSASPPLMGGSGGAAALFPNPASDHVRVAFRPSGDLPVRLQLYNSLGRLVQEAETNAGEYRFDLTALAAGHYWIAILPGENHPLLTLPFEKINH